MKGIDTSKHNGAITAADLNGIDFVIIRCGYGGDYTKQDDPQFENTVKLCESLNKPYGVYLYSYADTVEKAKSEAAHMIRLVNGRKPACGLWYDVEDEKMASGETLVQIVQTFCDLTGAGIYASKYWLENKLNDARLDKYKKWVAQWASECTYNKPYEIWQYTDNLMINGRRFDGNISLVDFTENKTPTETETTVKKSNETIANEVLQGLWGNGEDRKNRLTAAGYDYNAIQSIVNSKVSKPTPKPTYTKGTKIVLNNKPLYVSATAANAKTHKSGVYYIYDGEKTNGRYRITNKQGNCGKRPPALYVTGWVEL